MATCKGLLFLPSIYGLQPARWPSVPPDLHFSVYHFTMAVLWATRSDTAPRTGPRQEGEVGMRVYGLLTLVMALLQRERRVSYWALKQEFGLDDAFIEGLKQELIVAKRVATTRAGKCSSGPVRYCLPATQAVAQSTPIEAAVTLHLLPRHHPGHTDCDASRRPTSLPDLVRHAPEAERRQVTVLFCDLVDSTQLSQHLDAEDYRAVVRAYQKAAVTAMQPWDGYVAQYSAMASWSTLAGRPPTKRRSGAVHASPALLAALEPLNTTQLEPRYGVWGAGTSRAAYRHGGDWGNGWRPVRTARHGGHAEYCRALFPGTGRPDTVVLSAVTARLVPRRPPWRPWGRTSSRG